MSSRRTVRTLPPFETFTADVLSLDPSTRQAALVIQKALDGSPLDDDGLALFRTYTGRETPRVGGYPYGLILVGRQAGKTEQAASRLVYSAVGAVLAGMKDVAVVGMSQDHRSATRALFTAVQRMFESPLLRGNVVSQTADSITLQGNVRLLILPCRPAALRGLRCVYVVLDEVCHFRSTDNQPLDREAWRAALATLLTTRGRMSLWSSPYAASGLAFDLHRAHWGRDSDVLVWSSPSYVLHPGLDVVALNQIRAVDPDGAAAEIEGEFLRHVAALHDEETLEAAVDAGVTVRPRVNGIAYTAHVDVATGAKATGDRWTCAIGHAAGDELVNDALLVIRPPFSPTTAAEQTARFCHAFGITVVTGDQFAQGFSNEAFARAGLQLQPSQQTTSDLHLEFAGLLSSGRVRLLDLPDLLAELRGIERRRGPTRDRADHRRGGHDDQAAVVAGVLTSVARAARSVPFDIIGGHMGLPSTEPTVDANEAAVRRFLLENDVDVDQLLKDAEENA